MIHTEFKCPKCGSQMFGSSKYGSEWTRHCHGYVKVSESYAEDCGFSFFQSEDYKYFHFVAEDQASFEKFYKLSHETLTGTDGGSHG